MKFLKSAILLAIIGLSALDANAMPSELQLLREEMMDMHLAGLQKDGITHTTGNNLLIRNRPTNTRLREDEPYSSYLFHNETNFESDTTIPLEYMSLAPKQQMEMRYLNSTGPQERLETGLNSVFGAWYQMLMFQEPTLAQGGMNIKGMWDTTLASYQADRSNEINHRRNLPKIAREVFDAVDKCIADGMSGLFGGLNGDLESIKQGCQSQSSLSQFLSARGALGLNQCEWGSMVMFKHLSLEVSMRMRAMFGDDELCPDMFSVGSLPTFRLNVIPPSFSMRQVWWEEYELAILRIENVLDRAAMDNGGYQLTIADLALINIRPSVKVSQALITAIEDGLDPLRERKELVHWWAAETANAFFDFACSEAESNLREAAASPASPTEHARWRKKVDAVCGVRKEVQAEMSKVTQHQEVFAKILEKGDKATSTFANATVGRAARDRSSTRRSFGSTIPSDSAMKEYF
jgi:hypothetical protein